MRRKSGFKNRFPVIFLGVLFCSASFCAQLCAGDIAVYGDSQNDPDIQRKIAQAVLQFKPSVVFRVGDLVDDGSDPGQWMRFREIASPLLNTAEYFPSLGNHEMDSSLYFREFPRILNRRWYSVDRQGIHFVVLDSNSDLQPDSEQYKWLLFDLSIRGRNAKFKVAIFHHPLFSSGTHAEDEKGLRPVLLPLFERYGVSAVFSGHDHNYQRLLYHGIYFIVTGGGGSFLADRNRVSPYLEKFAKAYHFCLLSPGDYFLSVRVIDVDSNLIDQFQIPARSLSFKKDPVLLKN